MWQHRTCVTCQFGVCLRMIVDYVLIECVEVCVEGWRCVWRGEMGVDVCGGFVCGDVCRGVCKGGCVWVYVWERGVWGCVCVGTCGDVWVCVSVCERVCGGVWGYMSLTRAANTSNPA